MGLFLGFIWHWAFLQWPGLPGDWRVFNLYQDPVFGNWVMEVYRQKDITEDAHVIPLIRTDGRSFQDVYYKTINEIWKQMKWSRLSLTLLRKQPKSK